MSSPISSWAARSPARCSAFRSSTKGRWRQVVGEALANAGTRIPSLRAKVEHLSGGQRQAIELNRFVHWGGKLVLLDEPFAALGVEQTRRGLDMIRQVAARGIGVVIITHIMQQAFQVADRIVVIRQGVVAGDVARSQTSPDAVINMITGENLAGAGSAGKEGQNKIRHNRSERHEANTSNRCRPRGDGSSPRWRRPSPRRRARSIISSRPFSTNSRPAR